MRKIFVACVALVVMVTQMSGGTVLAADKETAGFFNVFNSLVLNINRGLSEVAVVGQESRSTSGKNITQPIKQTANAVAKQNWVLNQVSQTQYGYSTLASALSYDAMNLAGDFQIISTSLAQQDGQFSSEKKSLLQDVDSFEADYPFAVNEFKHFGLHVKYQVSVPKSLGALVPSSSYYRELQDYLIKLNREESGWYIEIDGVEGEKYSGALDVMEFNSVDSHTISGTFDASDQAIIPIQGTPQSISVVVQDTGADGGIGVSINDTTGDMLKYSHTGSNYGVASVWYSNQ